MRQNVISLRWPERDYVPQRNVDATAKYHGESIFGGTLSERAGSGNRLANLFERIGVHIAVCRAKQKMPKRLYAVRSYLNLRAKRVCKYVTGNLARRSSGEDRIRWNTERARVALVPLQIHLNAEVFVDVYDKRTATAVQAVAVGISSIWVEADKRVIRSHFEPRKLLGRSRQPEQHHYRCQVDSFRSIHLYSSRASSDDYAEIHSRDRRDSRDLPLSSLRAQECMQISLTFEEDATTGKTYSLEFLVRHLVQL